MRRYEFALLYHHAAYEFSHRCDLVTRTDRKSFFQPPIGLLHKLSLEGWEIRQVDEFEIPRGDLYMAVWLQREITE